MSTILDRQIDHRVDRELRVFLTVLSHLPVEAQLDILHQATEQISELLEGGIA